MIFETHAHYNDEKFDSDREEVFQKIRNEGVEYVINTADSIESSKISVDFSKKYDFIFATCGVHPQNVAGLTETDIDILKNIARDPKVVAIGEIGLDYFYDEPPAELQKIWFRKQIEAARDLRLPIVVHDRDAHEDTLSELRRAHSMGVSGVLHCFSGSREMAEEVVKLGFMLSVGGVITFKNAKKLPEVIKWIPMEYLLLETDCPYLAPEPLRGTRNDSGNIKYIAAKVAEIKGLCYDEVCSITNANACRLFFGK